MTKEFELEKNRKAFIYTVIICISVLLLFFFIRWKHEEPVVPQIEEFEINLGNNFDGFGEEQPLVKGPRGIARENNEKPRTVPAANHEKVIPEDDGDGAPISKPVKQVSKPNTSTTTTPVPKQQAPKITYNGPKSGNGNNDTEDNGYRYQGNTPGGKGDNGDPNGHPDSYGTKPGGKIGGPKVTRGNRKIIRYYSFQGDLAKATIYAIIKVSPAGKGTFIGFDKGSTSRSQAYADAISNYLANIKFDEATDESNVTVQFNFNVQ